MKKIKQRLPMEISDRKVLFPEHKEIVEFYEAVLDTVTKTGSVGEEKEFSEQMGEIVADTIARLTVDLPDKLQSWGRARSGKKVDSLDYVARLVTCFPKKTELLPGSFFVFNTDGTPAETYSGKNSGSDDNKASQLMHELYGTGSTLSLTDPIAISNEAKALGLDPEKMVVGREAAAMAVITSIFHYFLTSETRGALLLARTTAAEAYDAEKDKGLYKEQLRTTEGAKAFKSRIPEYVEAMHRQEKAELTGEQRQLILERIQDAWESLKAYCKTIATQAGLSLMIQEPSGKDADIIDGTKLIFSVNRPKPMIDERLRQRVGLESDLNLLRIFTAKDETNLSRLYSLVLQAKD
jgi:hypothetical protein